MNSHQLVNRGSVEVATGCTVTSSVEPEGVPIEGGDEIEIQSSSIKGLYGLIINGKYVPVNFDDNELSQTSVVLR